MHPCGRGAAGNRFRPMACGREGSTSVGLLTNSNQDDFCASEAQNLLKVNEPPSRLCKRQSIQGLGAPGAIGWGSGVTHETIAYFRAREAAERAAVASASCDEPRWAHEQMADAYARLVEIEELKAAGALAPGKVIAIADVLRERGGADYERRSAPLGFAHPAAARQG